MTTSVSYRRGEVVLISIPFTDQPHRTKPRPVVIVSVVEYNAIGPDLLVATITSNPNPVPHLGDHRIEHWQHAGLRRPSIVQAKLATSAAQRVLRTLGTLHPEDFQGLTAGLRQALGLA